MGALMAGAKYKGEYEERIKSVLNEVEKAAEDGGPGVILFIDEMRKFLFSVVSRNFLPEFRRFAYGRTWGRGWRHGCCKFVQATSCPWEVKMVRAPAEKLPRLTDGLCVQHWRDDPLGVP